MIFTYTFCLTPEPQTSSSSSDQDNQNSCQYPKRPVSVSIQPFCVMPAARYPITQHPATNCATECRGHMVNVIALFRSPADARIVVSNRRNINHERLYPVPTWKFVSIHVFSAKLLPKCRNQDSKRTPGCTGGKCQTTGYREHDGRHKRAYQSATANDQTDITSDIQVIRAADTGRVTCKARRIT